MDNVAPCDAMQTIARRGGTSCGRPPYSPLGSQSRRISRSLCSLLLAIERGRTYVRCQRTYQSPYHMPKGQIACYLQRYSLWCRCLFVSIQPRTGCAQILVRAVLITASTPAPTRHGLRLRATCRTCNQRLRRSASTLGDDHHEGQACDLPACAGTSAENMQTYPSPSLGPSCSYGSRGALPSRRPPPVPLGSLWAPVRTRDTKVRLPPRVTGRTVRYVYATGAYAVICTL